MTSVALLGAAPDTGNLGVNALYRSIVLGICDRIPDAEFCIFDNGRGLRNSRCVVGTRAIDVKLCGLSNTRRIYRPESIARMQLSALFGGLGNAGVDVLTQSHAVLDISGGDSFTDLYGARRFELISRPKQLAIRQRRPLILLPQTYGPFTSSRRRAIAKHILRDCHSAWARDKYSYAYMAELLGTDFDPSRHRCGVDVAFLLPVTPPDDGLRQKLEEFTRHSSGEIVGINISGLIYNDPDRAARCFSIKADYAQALRDVINNIVKNSDASILLIPHVLTPPGHFESDHEACQKLYHSLSANLQRRVTTLSSGYTETEIKWVISRLSWFCGTRMHSTIASLSTGVPSAAISYSDKTFGVFSSCEQEAQVFDPRCLATADLAHALYHSFCRRQEIKSALARRLPQVLSSARRQMDDIAQSCLQMTSLACP
ncbi:polysaccharide pyruvyl transferase family protein [Microbulbifer sp. SAOS-129_SWC]|uniref:polysaccharide pyruvyl transferase family protein n=1 Tax=Microbulbifer sp. SAOS-129_SWC TaxID=3145235 RepID=UPI003216A001